MAKAKKLPSGSWRCLAYSHTEKVWDEKQKKWKDKRIYESFTSDDPSPRGRKEAELAAAEFQANKTKPTQYSANIKLSEAIEKYIEQSQKALSGTTIQGYQKCQYDSYQELLNMRIRDITSDDLQDAVNRDCVRPSKRNKTHPKPISPKTVANTYGFIRAVIRQNLPNAEYNVKLPTVPEKKKELLPPEKILEIIKGTDIELPCLLAMWLSFSMSEIRGICHRNISDGYLELDQVIVDIGCTPVVKDTGKTPTRLRRHRLPQYILDLIPDGKPDDPVITDSGHSIYMKWTRLLEVNNLPHMTFHDLRHENASIMHMLNIPDKYAMERGGWKTDKVMKRVYTHTYSKEREKVDDKIDDFFEQLMSGEQKKDTKSQTLQALLAQDSSELINEFLEFMQHKMQHATKKVL